MNMTTKVNKRTFAPMQREETSKTVRCTPSTPLAGWLLLWYFPRSCQSSPLFSSHLWILIIPILCTSQSGYSNFFKHGHKNYSKKDFVTKLGISLHQPTCFHAMDLALSKEDTGTLPWISRNLISPPQKSFLNLGCKVKASNLPIHRA